MSIRTLSLLVGPTIPAPVPVAISDALERVEIESSVGERGRFRLTFRVDQPTLPERFLLDSADLLRVVLVLDEPRGASVVMDGVMVVHTLSTATEGKPRLVIGGEDLTLLMDLVDIDQPFPQIPIEGRVQLMLAKYAVLGIVPFVVPPRLLAPVALPTAHIPPQQGTDYAAIRSLAEAAGYRFTLDPGPTPASSIAYWGPEPHADRSHPALSIGFGRSGSIETLRLSFDANHRVLPDALVRDPATGAMIPLPAPDISELVPPLGAIVPPAHRHQRLRDTAGFTVTDAAAALLAKAARSAEAMTGQGALDVARAGVRLRAGTIVEVHGAAKPFDGLFMVSRVHDTITRQHHSQEFELLRAGIGAAAGGGPP